MDISDADTAARNREHLVGLARAGAGAIMFSLPLLMTMEMWSLGFSLDSWKLLQFTLANLAVLVGLSRIGGFEETRSWREDGMDALAAYAIAVLASAVVLALFSVVTMGMTADEIFGKIAVQAVPASFGAMIARKQLGGSDEEDRKGRKERETYGGELFLMMAGALFLSFNMAPTEEMVLIAYQMTYWHGVVLVLVSIAVMHAFVYGVGFSGQHERGEATRRTIFLRYTLAGYAIAVLTSIYVLWTFGRTEDTSVAVIAMMTAVLAFPSAIGAAIARLVV